MKHKPKVGEIWKFIPTSNSINVETHWKVIEEIDKKINMFQAQVVHVWPCIKSRISLIGSVTNVAISDNIIGIWQKVHECNSFYGTLKHMLNELK